LSPSRIRLALSGTAASRRAIISRSIIEASSTTTRSTASSGTASCARLLRTCSNLCSVTAWVGMCCCMATGSFCSADAIDSPSRAAALPVGAASAMRKGACWRAGSACSSASRRTTVVVLPVPGPPVMSEKRLRAASAQATFCQSGAALWPLGSNSCTSDSLRLAGMGQGCARRVAIEARMLCSAAQLRRRYRRSPSRTSGLLAPSIHGRLAPLWRNEDGSVFRSRQAWPRPNWWLTRAANSPCSGSGLGCTACRKATMARSSPVNSSVSSSGRSVLMKLFPWVARAPGWQKTPHRALRSGLSVAGPHKGRRQAGQCRAKTGTVRRPHAGRSRSLPGVI